MTTIARQLWRTVGRHQPGLLAVATAVAGISLSFTAYVLIRTSDRSPSAEAVWQELHRDFSDNRLWVPLIVLLVGLLLTGALAQAVQTAARLRRALEEQQRSEQALRDSEARFRSFMEHAPVEMVVKDLDGRIRMVSRAVEEIWDRPAEALLGRRTSDISDTPGVPGRGGDGSRGGRDRADGSARDLLSGLAERMGLCRQVPDQGCRRPGGGGRQRRARHRRSRNGWSRSWCAPRSRPSWPTAPRASSWPI